jgi:dihydrofolate synthase/folylpolyglutamate synthase
LTHQSQSHPRTIDLGLERLRTVLDRLGWQQPSVPVVTVAGTNGKGSVTAYCASILTAAGYRVGTFTSPHLRDYRERIRIHDRLVTSDELVRAFERIEAVCGGSATMGTAAERAAFAAVSLTFFEYNALAAFLIFEAARVDVWLLEVGMGGRLDAVNVVDPTVAVVVSIGLDHQEFLGTTLEAIAAEKAGIFRRDRAAVFGSNDMPVALVEIATALGARPKRLGTEFSYAREASGWQYRGSRWNVSDLPVPALVGDAQFANAATAVAALEELPLKFTVSRQAIARGVESVRLEGRFQIVQPGRGNPQWILDVAHNPDAARVLAQNLRASPTAGRTLAICGILADKDTAAIGAAVSDCFDAWWLASTDGERGTTADVLAQRLAPHVAAPLTTVSDIPAACAAAASNARPEDRIVVFGSFHTVGPALDWLESQRLLPRRDVPEYTGASPGQ